MRVMMMMKKEEEDCLASKTGVLGERTAGFSQALGKTRPLASKMARKREKLYKRGIFANKRARPRLKAPVVPIKDQISWRASQCKGCGLAWV